MKVLEAKKCFFDYHRVNSKPNTISNYELLLPKFCDQFGHRDLESITSEEVLTFLTRFTEGTKQSTRGLRHLYRLKTSAENNVSAFPSTHCKICILIMETYYHSKRGYFR
jgi:hypothetical protein